MLISTFSFQSPNLPVRERRAKIKTTAIMGSKNFTAEMDRYKARLLWARGQNASVTTATTSKRCIWMKFSYETTSELSCTAWTSLAF